MTIFPAPIPAPAHPMTPRDLHVITDWIIHHTAGPTTQTVRDIDQEHRTIGDAMIGYNWVIDPTGTIYLCRPPEFVPAAAYGRNTQSLNVSLIGNFQDDDPGYTGVPPQDQVASLIWLTQYVHARYPGIERTIGHRDIATMFYPNDPSDYATACPGNRLYVLIPQIRQGVVGQRANR